MRQIGIGLLGFGTVGSGVVKSLIENGASINTKLSVELKIRRILVRSPQKERSVTVVKELITTDFSSIVNDPQVDIVVEAMGGIEPAFDYIVTAIEKGKHVVTANKEVIAKHGREILQLADKHGVEVLFEASVGGGIPIIRPLKQCLAANKIEEIMGIINGTTNYILSKMASEGKDFAAMLQQAQAKGYAEPDPTNDVEGYDAAFKLVILTALAFGTPVNFSDISFAGISSISREDMVWADKLGYCIKLLAVAKEHPDGLEVRVGPSLLPCDHPLSQVNDVFNGIYVKGNLVGELLFTGRGAGDLPTASAVVADVIDVSRTILAGRGARPSCTCYRYQPVIRAEQIPASFYLRVNLRKAAGAMVVNQALSQAQVHSVMAGKNLTGGKGGSLVYFIEGVSEQELRQLLSRLRSIPEVKELSSLRVEGSTVKIAELIKG